MSVPAGPGGADADADVAGHRARVALGHVRGAFDVARQDVGDRCPACAAPHRAGLIAAPGHAEDLRHAFLFHHPDGGLCGCHLCHEQSPCLDVTTLGTEARIAEGGWRP